MTRRHHERPCKTKAPLQRRSLHTSMLCLEEEEEVVEEEKLREEEECFSCRREKRGGRNEHCLPAPDDANSFVQSCGSRGRMMEYDSIRKKSTG